MENSKVCESAYLAAKDQQNGAHLHGAAVAVRAAGATHFYLVRGSNSESVVRVLHKQLIKAGRLPQNSIASNGVRVRGDSKRSGSVHPATPVVLTLLVGLAAMIFGLMRLK